MDRMSEHSENLKEHGSEKETYTHNKKETVEVTVRVDEERKLGEMYANRTY